jgi:glycosyltransferase involved in cell wall biosynthesis
MIPAIPSAIIRPKALGMTNQAPSTDLAVALTAFNSMRTIDRVLASVRPIARRIVVVDSGSTDGTIECCRSHGTEVVHQPWMGHVQQKQFAIDQCANHAWILLLDSDESLESDLQASIARVVEHDDHAYDGWEINRKVWFLGGWLHHTYQPEWRLRLFRGGRGVVAGEGVHDYIQVAGRVGRLPGVCRHDSWADLRELAERQLWYAREACRSGVRGGTAFNLLVSPPAAMFKQFFLKGGCLDGRRGLIAAAMTFNHTMLKHAFLAAKRVRHGEADAPP